MVGPASLQELTELSHVYYERQWMFATAGNVSVRDGGSFWITASGKHKGKLTPNDFVQMDITTGDWTALKPPDKPSLEASIHRAIYEADPKIQAALHVHTLESNLLSYDFPADKTYVEVPIPPIEILKAYGIWEEKPTLTMPVFYNHLDVKKIAEQMRSFFRERGLPRVPFVLVEGHGPTVWGESLEAANRHLEATHFLFQVMVR